ncbi:acyltransferase [Naasia aerilata]|uniref:Acyltransferase n=1 Tax=Naasia aerilata TaxID=1162966 RepID=A0ABM8GDS5_9MICO|nr:acyltransferase [Naasia aerilata]
MLHHTLEIAKPYLAPASGTPVTVGSLWWWLTETPLKLASAGQEAVVVFFVLSGLVVALPAIRSTAPYSWGSFLASRFVRIYLPVWGALLLASGLIELLPREEGRVTAHSWLSDANATTVHGSILFDEATLSRYSFDIVNTLWSLRWEMVFAVLLPLYVLAARLVRRRWAAAGILAAGLTIAGFALQDGTLSYLPAFFLGTLIAANLDRYRAWAEARRSSRWFRPATLGALSVSAVCIIATWLARPVAPEGSLPSLLLTGLSVVGATGLVLLALAPTGFARGLGMRASQWLGRVSFSLYLVHVPLLVTAAFLLRDSRWPLVALLGIPVSLAVAALFQRFVEAPAHRLARRVGTAVRERGRRDGELSGCRPPARAARA